MRTTIEISDEQHRALTSLAQLRGIRGLSSLVQEALDAYLHDMSADEVDQILSLEGVLDEADAQEVRRRIEDVRSAWRAA
jgi:predicted DNA-binding protein